MVNKQTNRPNKKKENNLALPNHVDTYIYIYTYVYIHQKKLSSLHRLIIFDTNHKLKK